ncbi:hypothetical protein TRIATDRAFT_79919 [Trichoderma atroviride IMI 206040]|uniref:Extracellular membrane protein CFEM domain-containing protein n=1 Tax=Hypocrea atroviridis (strain ATCC 20476 / IMI 206040) TaxID=452589 RepID=G9NVI7_HYPAI|nr:uncharacterized protein TRIATDRAFT_79919 [Trichoderma atroviride IMI 206040]EHK45007.1 hypothetical protein TRIATDRAFT_79919 [Trichoderma atroviride IMI 206040]
MMFLATLLFAAAGVSAASSATSPDAPGSTCLADYILEDCLKSTTVNANNCNPTDYTCLCAAYQAIFTCYNNCPNDIRAPSVQNQVDSYCRTASLLATTTKAAPKTKTSGSSSPDETSASEASPGNDEAATTEESSSTPTSGGEAEVTGSGGSKTASNAARTTSSKAAAPTMIGSVAGIFMAVAGAAAAAVMI